MAPIYGPEPANPQLAKHGNTASGTPAGTQVYSGDPLSGAGFTVQLFGGPTNAAPEDLVPLIPQTTFQTGLLAGFVVPPLNALVIPTVAGGMHARLQLRCWDNQGGLITTWEQVLASPSVARGQSASFITPPLGDNFFPPPNLIGLQSFNLTVGEEPPVLANLSIVLTSTNTVIVSWPMLPDLTLQESADLEATNWVTSTETVTNNTTMNYILVSPLAEQRFYRLFKP